VDFLLVLIELLR